MSEAKSLDIAGILKALPHRYPLLLVDRVVSIELGERIHAVKAVTFNEQFFQGHFPSRPIMPGVLQVEAMAQAAAILGIETLELAGTGTLVYFMGIEGAKFRAPVEPVCLLDLRVEFLQ
jgi:3-hydroxyacyl-[acyl-carrier-protein] dehydratase